MCIRDSPLFSRGKIIGVVGIHGNPAEVLETAQLLGAYTIQFFEQNATWQQQSIENELRSNLLDMLISLQANKEEIDALLRLLHIQLELPLRVVVISLAGSADTLRRLHRFTPILAKLRNEGFLRESSDVWGLHENQITIVKSQKDVADAPALQRMQQAASSTGNRCYLSAGSPCFSLGDVKHSYEEASFLNGLNNAQVADFQDIHCRFQYLMYRSGQCFSPYVEQMYHHMCQAMAGKDIDLLLETAACYYGAQCSVTRAAEQLHIHKNTLQYRMKLLWDAMDIGELPSFEREYFVRLCILYQQAHHSCPTV